MPLITFSLNTTYENEDDSLPLGMDPDGSFTLRHLLTHPPPPETEYTLKQVSIDGGGLATSRNKQPTYWVSLDFPQLDERVIARDDFKETVHSEGGAPPHVNDRGTLRFPITIFPVDGRNTASPSILDANTPQRYFIGLDASPHYTHRGNHIVNVPLGKIRVDEGFITCKLTPRDINARLATESGNGDNLFCRLKQIQVILEYK